MSVSIIPTITWVNTEASESGKTVKVYLAHESFAEGVTHYAYIPVGANPSKWNRIEATTVKVDTVEVDYVNADGMTIALKSPRARVSFFGDCAILDAVPAAPTQWADKRTSAPAVATVFDEPF
jgi:hypothetical protein